MNLHQELVLTAADDYEGMYTVGKRIDGSAVKMSNLGNLANGYVQETDATASSI